MDVVTLPHLQNYPVHITLLVEVTNAPSVREQLLRGNADFQYAFLDASVILSKTQILAACFRSINDEINQRLKTHNVHSETVFALSPNNNIAESFRRFGISDDSKNVIAIKIGGNAHEIEAHLRANLHGKMVTLTEERLAALQDIARIRKIYRLEQPKKGEDASRLGPEAEAFILGSMALKGS